jgi:7-cyano-7-deazaguanine synthase
MLAISYGIAVARGVEVIGAAMHSGDHAIYPDCRPAFTEAFDRMERLAVDGYGHPDIRLWTPFINKTKTEIASIGGDLGIDYANTWSCYKGAELHCGACGTCYERKEAFQDSGVTDNTRYES